jgi:RsiW-degrading membrane proteinase PrsW (M82 family)
MMPTILNIAVSLLPIFMFLIILVSLDSYKLVRFRALAQTIFWGGIAAIAAYFFNIWISPLFTDRLHNYARYGSPVIEEILKGIFIIYLIQTCKSGFLVDSAIHGFAAGTGFAVMENIYYLQSLHQTNLLIWLIRGCGTAVMHGGTTAILAILYKSMSERYPNKIFGILPGLITAIFIHSIFNHFFLSPVVTTVIQLITLPSIMIMIFAHSEKVLRHWLEIGMDNDVRLLEYILTGDISETRIGRYLLSLKNKFPREIVSDMLCYMRIHLELAIRAKGILMMRNAGFRFTPEPEIQEKFNELKFLEKNIGTTGQLALSPILHGSTRDLWQLYFVKD